MPKAKMFPYPLEVGTHVVAKVRRLDLRGDETIAGTIVRVIQPRGGSAVSKKGSSVTYAIRTASGATIQALASRTTPIDTSTVEGLDQWLDTLDNEPDPARLPGVDLAELDAQVSGDHLRTLLQAVPPAQGYPNYLGQSPHLRTGQIWYDTSTNVPGTVSSVSYDSLTDTYRFNISSSPHTPDV